MFDETVLLKKGLRRDSIWTNRLAYNSFLKLLPLYLDTRALLRSQFWPRSRIERFQNERLSALFNDAIRVPYWRDLFSLAQIDVSMPPREILSKIPITTKGGLAGKPIEYIADISLIPISDRDNTSGSTGIPFHFYHDWHASLRSFAVTERIFRTTGKRYPIVYMRARKRNGFTFYRHIWFFMRGYNSVSYRMKEFKELGTRLKSGFILYGYTSWVLELARHMEKLGLQLPIRAVVIAGEHFSEGDRAYIERIMKAELFTLYASREAGFMGYECERHKMHICEEWAYLEIVDDKGRVLPPGQEGSIIVTTFDNRVMPFIRYEIGDLGVISDIPCECGRTSRTLVFKGRMSDLIELEDNRVVSLLDISCMLGSQKNCLSNYQLVQTGKMSFIVRVVPGPLYEQKKEYLEAIMVRMLHPRVDIRWEVTDSIEEAKSGKAMYFVRNFGYKP